MNAKGGNDKDVDFNLGMCTQLVHIMKEAFTCEWKIEFLTSDIVVVSKYYKNGAQVRLIMCFSKIAQ
jgi:hypothetical protein